MFVSIVNDCRDSNAMGRQKTRAAALFPDCTVTSIGVGNDLEAAGNLVDALDAGMGKLGAILVNVAPRNGDAHRHDNGTPFCFFWHQETLVVSSFAGLTLSLAKKLGITTEVHLLDLAATVKEHCLEVVAKHIIGTQFRSFEFVPRVAAWLLQGKVVASTPHTLDHLEHQDAVWLRDCFGNLKLTKLLRDLNLRDGDEVVIPELSECSFRFYAEGLSAVPDNGVGLVVGSSGIAHQRFLEVVVNGGSAAERFNGFAGMKLTMNQATLV